MRVDFHSGVADKQAAACRFLRKAQVAGATVVVCGDGASLDRLDAALWTFDPLSFVAHVRVRGGTPPSASMMRTPTWLVDAVSNVATRELLLNLGPEMVDSWEQFARVVEIVSADAADAETGRRRWRQYSARSAQSGFDLVHHARSAET